jgi:hypothetical protein
MRHKKQHWIPESYLKAWCDPDAPKNHEPYVWMIAKDGSASKNKAPQNIFCESEMYTIHGSGGERNLTLEHGLSGLEGFFARLRREKLTNRMDLLPDEKFQLLLFVAAMKSRTVAQRDHMQNQWGEALKMMDSLAEQMTKEGAERFIATQHSSGSGESLSHEQVRNLAEKPMQNSLFPMIISQTELLAQMHLSIIGTNSSSTFITSDSPCVWVNPEIHKLPPFYRHIGLGQKKTEVTLPVSPEQIILISWDEQKDGYLELNNKRAVEEYNRRTGCLCDKYCISNRNIRKDIWFDLGIEPEDSWEKNQTKQNNKGS